MVISNLDTHEIVKDVKAAGFTEEQAEAVTRAVKPAQDLDLSNLATKTDLAELRTDFTELRAAAKTDLAELRAATKTDLAELRAELIKWVVGVGFAQVAIFWQC